MTDRPPVPTEVPPAAPPQVQPIPEQNNLVLPINVNRDNFPTANNLNDILYNLNFNRILRIIRDRIETANLNNLNYVRILNADILNTAINVINNLKLFLINNGYQIILLEDANNISIGFKIIW
uniref:Uncharacterized protein n=1 Tax=viral metagenome TaxID=1070528 RepID=A0A6C0EBP3_9ZZZZ